MAMVTGNPMEDCVDMLLPGMRAMHPDLVDALCRCEETAVRSDGGRLCAWALEAVSDLARDFRVFLVSNCQERYLELFLDLSGLGPLLSGVDCHISWDLGKPAGNLVIVDSFSELTGCLGGEAVALIDEHPDEGHFVGEREEALVADAEAGALFAAGVAKRLSEGWDRERFVPRA